MAGIRLSEILQSSRGAWKEWIEEEKSITSREVTNGFAVGWKKFSRQRVSLLR